MRILIISMTCLLAACGQSQQTVSYTDSEGNKRSVEVAEDGDTRVVKSDDGMISAVGHKGGEKAKFTAVAAQYPGSNIASVVDLDMGGIKRHTIVLQSNDTPAAIIAFYKGKAEAAGEKLSMVEGSNSTLLAIGGRNLADAPVTISVDGKAGGMTTIAMNIAVP